MIRRIILLLVITLTAACTGGEKIADAPEAGAVIYLPEIEWRVVSRAELERVYIASGQPLEPGQSLRGFAATQGERILVYTLAPEEVDDDATLTLGHEVMHVALGDYHR